MNTSTRSKKVNPVKLLLSAITTFVMFWLLHDRYTTSNLQWEINDRIDTLDYKPECNKNGTIKWPSDKVRVLHTILVANYLPIDSPALKFPNFLHLLRTTTTRDNYHTLKEPMLIALLNDFPRTSLLSSLEYRTFTISDPMLYAIAGRLATLPGLNAQDMLTRTTPVNPQRLEQALLRAYQAANCPENGVVDPSKVDVTKELLLAKSNDLEYDLGANSFGIFVCCGLYYLLYKAAFEENDEDYGRPNEHSVPTSSRNAGGSRARGKLAHTMV